MLPSSIPTPKEQEMALLENQKKWLQQELEQVGKRLEELQSDKKEKLNE